MPKSKPVAQPVAANREALIAHADKAHRGASQYVGYFDQDVLVTITENVRVKSGLAFVKGEVALASPTLSVVGTLFRWRSVYSPRLKASVAIVTDAVQDTKGFRPKKVDMTTGNATHL